jgi:H+/Cl- antiporter ClcA
MRPAFYGSERRTGWRWTLRVADLWFSSTLAVLLVAAAIASIVAGMLVAFGFVTTGVTGPFRDALLIMSAGIIFATAANAFRRDQRMHDRRLPHAIEPPPIPHREEN